MRFVVVFFLFSLASTEIFANACGRFLNVEQIKSFSKPSPEFIQAELSASQPTEAFSRMTQADSFGFIKIGEVYRKVLFRKSIANSTYDRRGSATVIMSVEITSPKDAFLVFSSIFRNWRRAKNSLLAENSRKENRRVFARGPLRLSFDISGFETESARTFSADLNEARSNNWSVAWDYKEMPRYFTTGDDIDGALRSTAWEMRSAEMEALGIPHENGFELVISPHIGRGEYEASCALVQSLVDSADLRLHIP